MKADLDYFYNSIQNLDRENLILLAVDQHKELQDIKLHQAENKRINTETHIQFMELKDKYDRLLESYEAVVKENIIMHDKLCLKNKAIFGSHTEKFLNSISGSGATEEFEDESQVEDTDTTEEDNRIVRIESYKEKRSSSDSSENKKSSSGKKKSSLKESAHNLPQKISYNLDVRALDEKYGVDNWSIAFWKHYETIKTIPASEYLDVVYEPVIEFNNSYVSSYYEGKLLPHSLVSPSLLADILYKKFVLSLPFHRQSADFCMHGLMLSKQTIIGWANTLVPEYLAPISEYMLSLLTQQGYVQSDETYLLVLKDGRAPSTKSFLWVHCTSELSEENPIVVFCYEPTRITEHLRRIFGDFTGYMTSDAYVSYSVMEEESGGCFRVTGCFMHYPRSIIIRENLDFLNILAYFKQIFSNNYPDYLKKSGIVFLPLLSSVSLLFKNHFSFHAFNCSFIVACVTSR